MSRQRLLAGCCFVCLFLVPALAGLSHRRTPERGSAGDRRGPVCPVLTGETLQPADGRRYFHWRRLPVCVFFAARCDSERQSARTASLGFDEWAQATGGAVSYRLVDTPAQAQITVRFEPGPTLPEHPDLVGITNTAWTGAVLEAAEIVLAVGQKTPAELRTVAAHEFGHALGIRGHSADPADLMFPALRRPPGDPARPTPPIFTVTPHDLAALACCYPTLSAVSASAVRPAAVQAP